MNRNNPNIFISIALWTAMVVEFIGVIKCSLVLYKAPIHLDLTLVLFLVFFASILITVLGIAAHYAAFSGAEPGAAPNRDQGSQ